MIPGVNPNIGISSYGQMAPAANNQGTMQAAQQGAQPPDAVSLGGSSPRPAAGAPPSGKQAEAIKSLQGNIDMLEQMKSLMIQVGNTSRANEISAALEQKKKALEQLKNGPPPPTFSDDQKEALAAFFQGKGPIPAGLDSGQCGYLDHMKSLSDQGLEFRGSKWEVLRPADAYVGMMENPVPTPGNQVTYATRENNNIAMATLRPSYLKPLDHYVTYAKKGFVFYEKTPAGMRPLKNPREFMDVYKNNPEEALVWAVDGSYTTAEKALKISEDIEKKGLIAGLAENSDKPEVIEEDDCIIIDGIVLKKNKSNE